MYMVLTKINMQLFRPKTDYTTIVTFDHRTFLPQRFYSGAIEASYPTTKFLFCYSNAMSLEVVVAMLVHLAIITM